MMDTEREHGSNAERDRAILAERARRLAIAPSAPSPSSAIESLSFSVSGERYAIESRFVIAVLRLVELVPLPGAEPPVAGLTRWRGEILTLIDIRRLVGTRAHALDDLGRVIVLGGAVAEFGILADVIDGIALIDEAALHPPPVHAAIAADSLIRGVTEAGLQLLDAAALIVRQSDFRATSPATPVASASPSTSERQ